MTGLVLFSVLLSLISTVGFILVWIKMHKPHEDPRLSRGLQLMQTKMSVLEDLSERIDTQASQLFSVLENKRLLTDDLVKRSNENHQRMEALIRQGTDALRAFDSQNPIEEMVKEKNVEKLNRARGMIESGFTARDVVQELGLSHAEVDFIEQMKRSTTANLPPRSQSFASPAAPSRTSATRNTDAQSGRVEIQRVQFPRITSHSL